ncbi:T9SS type A sorting domain-containing protein [Candidatus Neomarinimicrobiota bacterium]
MTLVLPRIKVLSNIDTIVIPISLINEWDEVGGVQLDLSLEKWGLDLDTILTTPRSAGWKVESRILDLSSNRRILLFDPVGNNILPGDAPIMELVVLLPEDTSLPDSIPLTVESAVVSDVMGGALLSKNIGGALLHETAARVVVGRARVDQGQTGRLGIYLSSSSPIMGTHFTCRWDTSLMSIVDITAGNQLADFDMEWERNGHGAWIGLSNQTVTEQQLGVDDSLILHLKVVPGVRFSEAGVRLMDSRMIDAKGREWRITHVDSGSIEVYPGYLDPPESLVALSGQDGCVPLSWRPPGGEDRGEEALPLVDDDASELAPPYFDAGGRMADALTGALASQTTTLPLTGYAIYRNEVNGVVHDEPELLATLNRGNHTFEDSSAINGRTYSYVISAIYQDQFESDYSEAVLATPASWIDFGIGHARTRIEHKAQVPVRIKNDAAISGLRFKLREIPIGAVVNPTAVLGPHSPPDWVVSVERDSTAQEWSIVAFSPQLTVIPAGEGNVLLLAMDPVTDVPVTVNLEPVAVEVLDPHGNAYPSRITPGMVDIDVPPVQLRIGTGPPTSPGDTGFISIYMDNQHPVRMFRMVLLPANGLEFVDVAGTPRLPGDAHVAWSDIEGGGIRLIELSFTNTPVVAGSGPIATVSALVDSLAPEGYVELTLGKEVLLGTAFGELPYASSPGYFPVGEVRAVFIPTSEKGAPGRVVTTALQLTNSAHICDFELQIVFNSQYLSFLSMEILERMSSPEGIVVQSSETGQLHLQYTGADSLPIAPGSGSLLNLVFFLAHATPGDSAYLLEVNQVAASGCQGQVIFARGESEKMIVGVPPPRPRHFAADVEPTGITHVLQLQSATLGGVYLDAGDELAVVDSGGWINAAGDSGSLVVGAGVVQADGSIQITAVLGFDPGGGAAVLPGARTGNPVYYLAWDHNSNTESRSGNDVHYVLGEGNWGENDGFTIVKVVRLGESTSTIPRPVPDDLIVTANDPNPFRTTTTIRFGVPVEMQVKIAVYDLMGREIAVLHDGITAPGYHGVEWDGRDDASSPMANGMYFYQVRTPDRTVTRKMLLLQ